MSRLEAPSAHEILAERLATGDLSPEDYRDRLALIGGGRRNGSRLLVPLVVMLIVLALAGLVITAVVAMGRTDMRSMMRSMPMMMGGDSGRQGSAPRAGAAERTIVADEFSFSPGTLRIREGEQVNLVLRNDGGMFHTLTVRGLGFELRAQAGESISGSLRATDRGEFAFVCTVPGHADAGMRGKILVEERGGSSA